MFLLRFDMRAPAGTAPVADLYATALEMPAFAEQHGCLSIVLCEHHSSEDGYLPSPLVLASAMAARTTRMPITIAVVLPPLYDPVRLASEMVVLDLTSRGRVPFVAAIGYVPAEYDMYGVAYHRRGRIADDKLTVLCTQRPANHSNTTAAGSTCPRRRTPAGAHGRVGRRVARRRSTRWSQRTRVLCAK